MNKKYEVVRLSIEAGSDLSAAADHGRTSSDIAIAESDTELIGLFPEIQRAFHQTPHRLVKV